MSDTKRLEMYADAILSHFGESLLDYEDYDDSEYTGDFDAFETPLAHAIEDGTVMNIPRFEQEDAFLNALEMAIDRYDSGNNESMDEDYGYYGENVIRDANELLHLLNESNASRKAKKLGLVHIGFGNYAEEQGSSAKYKTVNGKLKKVGGTTAKKQKVSAKATTSAKKKEDPKKKKVQSGVTDLRRVSGEKFTYEFKKDGRKYKFTLNKKERKDLKDTSVMSIVKARLKKREDKEKTKQFKKGKPVSTDSK